MFLPCVSYTAMSIVYCERGRIQYCMYSILYILILFNHTPIQVHVDIVFVACSITCNRVNINNRINRLYDYV